MILAAGLGTRLEPVTTELPKPLVPVVGVPNIVRIVHRLREAGIRQMVLNSHWLPEVLTAHLGDGRRFGVSLQYSYEESLLGTGGGIKKALPLLGNETFLVVNGDALFAPDYAAVIDYHRSHSGPATLVVREDPQSECYGQVGLDADNRIRRLVWSGNDALVARRTMFTGLHVLEPDIAERLPENGCIVRETYIPMLEEGIPLYGYPVKGYFCDLGTPERYLQANIDLVTGHHSLPDLVPPKDGIHVGANVRLGDACRLLPGTVIGDDVRVTGGARIANSVVIDGATVDRDLNRAIVTPGGKVVQV